MFHLLLCSADNVKVAPDGSVITITNVRPMNHGAYRCVASNPFGITQTIVSLIVKGETHGVHYYATHRDFSYFIHHTPLKPQGEGLPLVADQIFCILCPLESPVAIVTPGGPVRVRTGEPINLECQASGEPRPTVSWHRLDSNRKTMLSSPVPMESNAVMQVTDTSD